MCYTTKNDDWWFVNAGYWCRGVTQPSHLYVHTEQLLKTQLVQTLCGCQRFTLKQRRTHSAVHTESRKTFHLQRCHPLARQLIFLRVVWVLESNPAHKMQVATWTGHKCITGPCWWTQCISLSVHLEVNKVERGDGGALCEVQFI